MKENRSTNPVFMKIIGVFSVIYFLIVILFYDVKTHNILSLGIIFSYFAIGSWLKVRRKYSTLDIFKGLGFTIVAIASVAKFVVNF
jgi:hypothetical protein